MAGISDYVLWEGLVRLNADQDNVAPRVRVHFTTGSYVPYSPATWEQPAEGGYFEDVKFVRAEIDPRDADAAPLTADEIAAARAWFDDSGSDDAEFVAHRALMEAQHDR